MKKMMIFILSPIQLILDLISLKKLAFFLTTVISEWAEDQLSQLGIKTESSTHEMNVYLSSCLVGCVKEEKKLDCFCDCCSLNCFLPIVLYRLLAREMYMMFLCLLFKILLSSFFLKFKTSGLRTSQSTIYIYNIT